jgi:molybdate transport system permease protein
MNWESIILTFNLALITTLILLVISIPIAFWMSQTKSKAKPLLLAIINLPLILPPTVLGFYLLIAFAPNSVIGGFFNDVFGIRLAFSFTGLVIGSIIYSLPFMIQPIYSGLQNLPENLSQASYVLGKSKKETLLKVLLPNIKPSILTGIVLSFAHTIGEFGVVLMIGGNIPGETKVLSIEIYDQVESMNHGLAHQYALALVILSIIILFFVYWKTNKSNLIS